MSALNPILPNWKPLLAVILAGAVMIGQMVIFVFEPSVYRLLELPEYSTGSEPPWGTIRRDFVHGVSCLGYVLLTLVIASLIWRWSRECARLMVLCVLAMNLPHAIKALVIYIRCPHFLDPTKAESAWPTRAAYHADAMMQWLPFSGMMAMLLSLWLFKRCSRRKSAP